MLTLAPQVYVARFAGRSKVRTAAWIVGFAALMAVLAQVRFVIPQLTSVPFTGQTLGVLAAGAALGSGAGAASMGLYVALGAAGLPIFSNADGGLDAALGATSGYLVGFVVAAYVVGRLAEQRADRTIRTAIPSFAAGTVIIYVFGMLGLMLRADMSPAEAFTNGVLPFLAWDALKAVGAGVIAPAAWRLRNEE